MIPKKQFSIEYDFHSSPQLLFQYLSTPSGLSEWFSDDVNSRGEKYTFFWSESEEDARLLSKKPYEKVKRGDVISTSGNSGISSGPHLHFEIWKDGEPVDPLLYFPELNKSNISVK